MHENDIVHRDLKPENVLVGNDGYILLANFEISARITDLDGQKPSMNKHGSLLYAAPETI